MIPLFSLSLAATACFSPLTLTAPVVQQAEEGAPARPRLVVLLSVDQMIPEQLTRLRPAFTGGFGRLLEEGTVFGAATLDYARTETGAGHATLSTGCLPRSHGL
ncbi:MAG: alkaline phosphatase family protein, partial [Planctomycetota bacterium]